MMEYRRSSGKSRVLPILFNSEMVRAILSWRKTQTRRLSNRWRNIKSGDYLWVKESIWRDSANCDNATHYVADNPDFKKSIKSQIRRLDWYISPTMYMCKKDCRILLEVESVEQQKLHSITEHEAENEGIEVIDHNCYRNYMAGKNWYYEGYNQVDLGFPQDAIGSFASLWDSINGKKLGCRWANNPEVTVIRFKVSSTDHECTQALLCDIG